MSVIFEGSLLSLSMEEVRNKYFLINQVTDFEGKVMAALYNKKEDTFFLAYSKSDIETQIVKLFYDFKSLQSYVKEQESKQKDKPQMGMLFRGHYFSKFMIHKHPNEYLEREDADDDESATVL